MGNGKTFTELPAWLEVFTTYKKASAFAKAFFVKLNPYFKDSSMVADINSI